MICKCGAPATHDVALQDPDYSGVASIIHVCDASSLKVGDDLDGREIVGIWPCGQTRPDPEPWKVDREEMFAVRGVQAGMMR